MESREEGNPVTWDMTERKLSELEGGCQCRQGSELGGKVTVNLCRLSLLCLEAALNGLSIPEHPAFTQGTCLPSFCKL